MRPWPKIRAYLPFSIFARAVRAMAANPAVRVLVLTTVSAIAGGTFFYHRVEDLSWLDSLYLTVMTLTTVGYGDIAPETAAGRLFTVFYVFLGIGLVAATITEMAKAAMTSAISETESEPTRGSLGM